MEAETIPNGPRTQAGGSRSDPFAISSRASGFLRGLRRFVIELRPYARFGRTLAGAVKLGATHLENFFADLERFAGQVGATEDES